MALHIIHGDSRVELSRIPDRSVDAVVTDPPHEIAMMGKTWDHSGVAFDVDLWSECRRVLKPGGYVVAFGASRTWHRLACAIEDAGFEIRDSIAWINAQGFPKSMDVEKAYRRDGQDGLAEQWKGWGTTLKPAFEPTVCARKPCEGRVIDNLAAYGTGALNIDGCRVQRHVGDRFDYGVDGDEKQTTGQSGIYGIMNDRKAYSPHSEGRFPSNVAFDEEMAGVLDAESGVTVSRRGKPRAGTSGQGWGMTHTGAEYNDAGGASRFFPVFHYEKKAPSHERPVVDGQQFPTVKPLALMRWCVRLVCPVGGTVLDPFAGSGTTLQAAEMEGMNCLGIEKEAEHIAFIRERLGVGLAPAPHTV